MADFDQAVQRLLGDHLDAGRSDDADDVWLRVGLSDDVDLPRQGWKLHVSATTSSAIEVFERAVRVLLETGASFKFARTLQHLRELNDGTGGLSQVGKFITVYPRDDREAVELARALDHATRGLPGSTVPSDRRLAAGSLVHYRFGSFDGTWMQTDLGELVEAITAPDGTLEPDRRLAHYAPPTWVDDPFVRAGVAPTPDDKAPSVLNRRYLVIEEIDRSVRGEVHLAVDLIGREPCILKRARAHRAISVDGADARDHLRHEWQTLAQLGTNPWVPKPIEMFDLDDDVYLAIGDIPGVTLEDHIGSEGPLSSDEVVSLAIKVADALESIHRAGFVFRDLKPTNVLVTSSGDVRLVDFELATPIGERPRGIGSGTRGYMSPQQSVGGVAAVTDDVYSFGAIVYLLATSAEPSLAPAPTRLLDRPVQLLNPRLKRGIAAVIERCVRQEPRERYDSLSAAKRDLSRLADARGGGRKNRTTALRGERMDPLRDARAIGDSICRAARPGENGSAYWVSVDGSGAKIVARDLNTGVAGTLLALAEIVETFNDPTHRAVLAKGAHWLRVAQAPGGERHPGLYVGESGVGTALLRCGEVLNDPTLLKAAIELSRSIARRPYRSPDVFNGTAGRARFHLWVWYATHDPEHLEAALAAGSELLRTAQNTDSGRSFWVIPDGYGSLSGSTPLGYAHGTAGIADVLLDLYDASGDATFKDVAGMAARWLSEQAVPGPYHDGANWPVTPGANPSAHFWCHGAAGVGQFMLNAADASIVPDGLQLAEQAAITVGNARWAGPTQCHGLAGNIEFVLDVESATGNPRYREEAEGLGQVLGAFAVRDEGLVRFPSDLPTTFSPDYMTGYAGVALSLLRLGSSEPLGRQLTGDHIGMARARNVPAPAHAAS